MTKATCLLVWIGMLSAAFAQQPTASANGTARGQAQAASQAAQRLYRVTAQITNDPSSGYQIPRGDQSDWPAVTEAQRQWYAAPLDGLSGQDRARLIPCAAHQNTAIDAMERGYRIEISQKGNSAAQKSVQTLYALGRKEFGLCNQADLLLTSTSATVELSEPQRLEQIQMQMNDLQRKFDALKAFENALEAHMEAACASSTKGSELSNFSCDFVNVVPPPDPPPAPAPGSKKPGAK